MRMSATAEQLEYLAELGVSVFAAPMVKPVVPIAVPAPIPAAIPCPPPCPPQAVFVPVAVPVPPEPTWWGKNSWWIGLLATTAVEPDAYLVAAGCLHDTIEDTRTTKEELEKEFGRFVSDIVLEVTDDKSLPKETRKRLQIATTAGKSREARLLKQMVSLTTPCDRMAPGEAGAVDNDLAWADTFTYGRARELVIQAFERRYVARLLRRARGNLAQASRLARLDRSNLRRILMRHGVRIEQTRAFADPPSGSDRY